MKKFWSRLWVPALTLALLGTIPGCSSDDDGTTDPPTRVDLSGNYTMVSITSGGITLTPAEGATGTLTLTETRYTINLNLPGQEPFNDSGTYVALSDGSWGQESDNPILPQSTGTYVQNGNQVTVDSTTGGQQNLTVWQSN
jgi:hypothetical protein